MEMYANRAFSTLTTSISDSDTSLTLTDASDFPPNGSFRVIIDDELVIVTSVSGNTFTVSRGAENTLASPHASGASLSCVLTAGAVESLRRDQTSVNLADGTFNGQLAIGPGGSAVTNAARVFTPGIANIYPPARSPGWGWHEQDFKHSVSVDPQTGSFSFYMWAAGGSNRTDNSFYELGFTGGTIEASLQCLNFGANSMGASIYVRDSQTARAYYSPAIIEYGGSSDLTSFQSYTAIAKYARRRLVWDSVQRQLTRQVSIDGVNWLEQSGVINAPADFTPDKAGMRVFLNHVNNHSSRGLVSVNSFRVY